MERMRRIRHDHLWGGYGSQHELAVRHGLSDMTICRYIREMKAVMREEFAEETRDDFVRRVRQYEMLFFECLDGFRRSQLTWVPCEECGGKGKNKDGGTCVDCDGAGRFRERRAGNPAFLNVAKAVLAEICDLLGHGKIELPAEKTGDTYNLQQINVSAGGLPAALDGAPPELIERHRRLVIEQRRLLLEVERSKNGRGETLDVEGRD